MCVCKLFKLGILYFLCSTTLYEENYKNNGNLGFWEKKMLETRDLILDKAKFSDWKDMYNYVWSQPESAKYMEWRVTQSENDARIRMHKTIAFQKKHDTYLVYEKASGKAIGFAGIEKVSSYVYQETGICLGPEYVRKGFGKQILQALIQYCKKEFGARKFIYTARQENVVSNRLAESLGFKRISWKPKTDSRDGHSYNLLRYCLIL